MHNIRASPSHLTLFSSRQSRSFPIDADQQSLARSLCLGDVRTTTGFNGSRGSQTTRRFLSRLAAFPRTNILLQTIERPKSVLSSSLSQIVHMSTLSAYLQEQKRGFLKDGGDGWTVVTGNEAGDLDSLASSIGFAWLLSHIPTTDTKAIALITAPRKDFVLRAENLYALEQAGIRQDFQELLCPEDVPQPNVCTNVALVDHNTLHPTTGGPNARVTAIIDHHQDEGRYLDTASPRIIEPAGSCASLVTRVIKSYPTLQMPPELAGLLLSAIVIDTNGLRKGGKAVDADYEASAWLLPRTNAVSPGNLSVQDVENLQQAWIQSLLDTLRAKKFTLSHLCTRDLLRRDYKEYDLKLCASICGDSPRSIKAGLATVPTPLSSFFLPSPNSTVKATQEWIQERGLSVLGVLTSYKSKRGNSRREALWVIDETVCGDKLPNVFFDGFEANEVVRAKRVSFERFGFGGHSEMDGNGGGGDESVDEAESGVDETSDSSLFGVGVVARVYRPKNTSITRKQVAPIMKGLLEG